MKEFSPEDIEKIERLIDSEQRQEVLQELEGMHPADIAELFQHLNLNQAEWVFELIPNREEKADILMELDEEDRKKLMEGMDPEQISVSPAVRENFIDPKFEERRNAVPLHWVLPDDQIGTRQRLLFGGNVDIEVRIELIKRANFDAFQRPCLFKHPFIRMGMMRIWMRINYKNHR